MHFLKRILPFESLGIYAHKLRGTSVLTIESKLALYKKIVLFGWNCTSYQKKILDLDKILIRNHFFSTNKTFSQYFSVATEVEYIWKGVSNLGIFLHL